MTHLEYELMQDKSINMIYNTQVFKRECTGI